MGSMGLIFILIGGVWAVKTLSFTASAKPAQGRIEGFEERESTTRRNGVTRKKILHYPVFTFKDEQGADHRVTAGGSQSKSDYTVGQEVAVLYNPENLQDARINNYSQIWLGPCAFIIMGSVFAGLGFIIYKIALARTPAA